MNQYTQPHQKLAPNYLLMNRFVFMTCYLVKRDEFFPLINSFMTTWFFSYRFFLRELSFGNSSGSRHACFKTKTPTTHMEVLVYHSLRSLHRHWSWTYILQVSQLITNWINIYFNTTPLKQSQIIIIVN